MASWVRLLIALAIAAAVFVARRLVGEDRPFNALARALFYGVIPPTIFMAVVRAPSVPLILLLTLVAALHMGIMLAATLGASSSRRSREAVTVACLSSMPNVVFLAFPVAIAVLGTVSPMIPYAVAFNALLPAVIAVLSSWFGSRASRPNPAPHIAAFCTATLLKWLSPSAAEAVASCAQLHQVLAALNLLAFAVVGSELAASRMRRALSRGVGVVVLLRFVASPLLMLGLLALATRFASIPRVYWVGMLMQSVMAPAITNIVLAKVFNLDTELAATSIAVTTPASVAIAIAIASL